MTLERILVANRGEIAVRVIRAIQEMGLTAIAIFSEADQHTPHAVLADEAYPVGESEPAASYLNIKRILEVCALANIDAVHPGYGFLSERADFAAAVEEVGMTFIGPRSSTIELMGDKIAAKRRMEESGVPVLPWTLADPDTEPDVAEIGYPLMIKAAAGGGGRGMRIVENPATLAEKMDSARREAESAFGDGTLFIERYLPVCHHVEFQLLGDGSGKVLHLYDRECSIQRRHQKIIEESPSPTLDEALRTQMGEAAVAAGAAVDYRGAGTVEFVVDSEGQFYFIEMNTRLQVEHPITELCCGLDLVKWQIRIASGEPLALEQEDIVPRGHAIEVRVCAEDPRRGFIPSTGRVLRFSVPQGSFSRLDSGIEAPQDLTIHYDPLMAKLICWGEDREEARRRLEWTMTHTTLKGIETNLVFLQKILAHPEFIAGHTTTQFIADFFADYGRNQSSVPTEALVAAALFDFLQPDVPRPVSTENGEEEQHQSPFAKPWRMRRSE